MSIWPDHLVDDEPSVAATIFGILVTLFVVLLAIIALRRFLSVLIDRALIQQKYPHEKEREQRRDTLVAVFSAITTTVLVIIGIVLVLMQLGVDMVALITGLGALGVVIGLAGQSMFKEIYKGISILLFDEMRIGDIVEIAGKAGVVESLSLFVTRLRDLDGMQHVVPNGEITVVTNMSHNFANVNFDVRVAYDTDITKAEEIMNKLGDELAEDTEFKDKFIEPIQFLRVDSFDDTGINLKALGKVQPAEQWGLAAEYRRRLLTEFKKAPHHHSSAAGCRTQRQGCGCQVSIVLGFGSVFQQGPGQCFHQLYGTFVVVL